ncbi:MAG: hypothetical protein HYT70_00250 [Candidatus Aenigmarchaeota archaeon]|nr:hypothetical protein [Candidatus Aenigmarchaeota archaeon]
MGKYLVFFMLVLSLVAFSGISAAIPTCTFRSGSCSVGEECMFSVLQENNSHVGSCNAYNTKVCCTEISSATVRSVCNSDEGGAISMYQTSNAHAGTSLYYSNVVCAKTSSNPIIANVRASCLARENCLVSVFQQNNSHVGSCSYYSNKVCIQEKFNMSITIILNTTSPNWNEGVGVQGNATRADGSAVDTSSDPANVELYVNSSLVCTTDTNSTGGYSCNFTAPAALGLYELNVTVDDPTNGLTSWNSTTFTVKQQFGEAAAIEGEAESIACYEEPRIVQNPDGTLAISTVRICVWK